jgi:hypothetical protein
LLDVADLVEELAVGFLLRASSHFAQFGSVQFFRLRDLCDEVPDGACLACGWDELAGISATPGFAGAVAL